ncbi:MAG TPA: hypothetical protein V6D50_05960 [Chroococcales cyanobacterium]
MRKHCALAFAFAKRPVRVASPSGEGKHGERLRQHGALAKRSRQAQQQSEAKRHEVQQQRADRIYKSAKIELSHRRVIPQWS